MEIKLLKLQLIYQTHSSKTLLLKIFIFATLMALIPCFDLIYVLNGCNIINSPITFQTINLHMNVTELNSSFHTLLSTNYLNPNLKKTLIIGSESARAVMVMRKLGFRDTVGVNSKPCSSLVKRGDIYALPLKEDSFDFVFSTAMIDGVKVPARMVLEMERVLKEGRVGVVLRRVAGNVVPARDVMKAAAPVSSYLKFSDVVDVRTVNCTVMVIFKKRFLGGLEQVLKKEKVSAAPLLLAAE